MKFFYLLLVCLTGLVFNAYSQAINEGALLSPYGTTNALVVFAEIDYSTGGCINGLGDLQNPAWESWPKWKCAVFV